jgi:hypothetical protein
MLTKSGLMFKKTNVALDDNEDNTNSYQKAPVRRGSKDLGDVRHGKYEKTQESTHIDPRTNLGHGDSSVYSQNKPKHYESSDYSPRSKFNESSDYSPRSKFNESSDYSPRSKFNQSSEYKPRSTFNTSVDHTSKYKFTESLEYKPRTKVNEPVEKNKGEDQNGKKVFKQIVLTEEQNKKAELLIQHLLSLGKDMTPVLTVVMPMLGPGGTLWEEEGPGPFYFGKIKKNRGDN